MGVSRNPQELAAKFSGLGADLKKRQVPALNKAALASKIAFLAAPGAPHGRLSGVGLRGARVGVKYTVFGDSKAVVRWFGPAHLVDRRNKPHRIVPKNRRRRGDRKQALSFNGNVVASVKHPGTTGKHFFAIGKKVAEKEATRIFRNEMHGAIVDRFR